MSSQTTDPLNKNKRKKLATRKAAHHPITALRRALRIGRRKRRLPTIRLGARKPRRGFSLVRLCRRAKLKWLRAKYLRMLKKLKEYHDSSVVVEGRGTMKSFRQRVLLEASFAIPVMGLSFINAHP